MTQTDDIQDSDPAGATVRRHLAEALAERDAALAREAALAEVLAAINACAGDPGPVFDLILDKAHALCHTDIGSLGVYDGTHFRKLALRGYSQDVEAHLRQPYPPLTSHDPLFRHETIHIPNIADHAFEPDVVPAISPLIASGLRAWLEVPLWSNGTLIGTVSGWRHEARAFSDQEIALLESFAAQATIAMENARLITETREALEQQTATAEVLCVINASPGDLTPVFDAVLEKAMRLCQATFGVLSTYDGARFRTAAAHGVPAAFAEYRRLNPPDYGPGTSPARVLTGEHPIHILDMKAEDVYQRGDPNRRAIVDLGGARTSLVVRLGTRDAVAGFIQLYRQEVRAFSGKQIARKPV